jgi:hypothetical protein
MTDDQILEQLLALNRERAGTQSMLADNRRAELIFKRDPLPT